MELNVPTSCKLCPRQCGADRTKTTGYCGAGSTLRVARAALHRWEEPCISGNTPNRGSGAVFFSGCPLGCVFCQNGVISHENVGKEITPEHLAEIFLRLQSEGAYNINLVTASQYWPWVEAALKLCRNTLFIPVILNSGGYECMETLHRMKDYVQIYLPDLKYMDSDLSQRYSNAGDYFAVASQAILEMVRNAGPVRFDDQGILQSGVIIRHLVLPGSYRDSIRILHWIAEHFEPESIRVSLMSQYTPQPGIAIRELRRPVFTYEYRKVCEEASELGLLGYTQERSSADACFTPAFDGTGV